MNLNRNNYEEYFILYLDNELGETERRQVEEFIDRNPDLKEELETLSQFKLEPEVIHFPGKINLLKSEAIDSSFAGNYEELILNYIDNELTADEKNQLEKFAEQNPAVKKELDFYQQTKLETETVLFPDKASLYRHETKVIRPTWWRIAAAAVILFAVGGYFLTRIENNNATTVTPPTASVSKKDNPTINDELVNRPVKDVVAKNEQPQVSTSDADIAAALKAGTEQKQKGKPSRAIDKKPEQNLIASTKTNDLPKPERNIYNNPVETNTVSRPKNTLTVPEEFKATPTVTPGITYTSNNETGTSEDDVTFNEQGGKKSKLRGFLRKVTRTFEKTTNISATDDEDRLLIGGLAIKLK